MSSQGPVVVPCRRCEPGAQDSWKHSDRCDWCGGWGYVRIDDPGALRALKPSERASAIAMREADIRAGVVE